MCQKYLEFKNNLSLNSQIGFSCESIEEVVAYCIHLFKNYLIIRKAKNTTNKNQK